MVVVRLNKAVFALLALGLVLGVSYAAIVGTSTIQAPAVILTSNQGSLTTINLTVTTGSGNVSVVGPSEVANSTIDSAKTAASYAASYLRLNFSNYNFIYDIQDNGNVSGPSAGAAMTLLAISALSHRPLPTDFTVTGTIQSDGTVGEVGGVYDKVSAAASDGLSYALVPYAQNGTFESELYLLVQSTFGLPLIEVSNISQAESYVTGQASIAGRAVKPSMFVDLHASGAPNATLACQNGCNTSAFGTLVNFTFNATQAQISRLQSYGNFANVSSQLSATLSQSETAADKGYLYAAADQAFLDYINTVFFNNYATSRNQAQNLLNSTFDLCSSVNQTQLTTANYEFVLGADLRQRWGNYTVLQNLATYNQSNVETDQELQSLYNAAESAGWCNAAQEMYNLSSDIGGNPVYFSQNLSSLALSRITAANKGLGSTPIQDRGIYVGTAQQAFNSGDYAVAIMDADYQRAFSAPIPQLSLSQLNSATSAIASNSTYGLWSTQFANQALFYIYLSQNSQNQQQAMGYAQQAYQVALLANYLSNDTAAIAQNMVQGQLSTTVPSGAATGQAGLQNVALGQILGLVYAMFVLLVVVLVVSVVTLAVLIYHIFGHRHGERPSGRRRR
ncbi:MAG: hypothetical protein KGH98_00075 [Candidatus Micrarchaeota archaeon]|nr:hypothetical protein [Candidatus Micrarchaeota archaeon]